MRKYCYRETGRKLRKHEFALERDTRFDERYYKTQSSPFRYYTEPKGDIMEKWAGQEWIPETARASLHRTVCSTQYVIRYTRLIAVRYLLSPTDCSALSVIPD